MYTIAKHARHATISICINFSEITDYTTFQSKYFKNFNFVYTQAYSQSRKEKKRFQSIPKKMFFKVKI